MKPDHSTWTIGDFGEKEFLQKILGPFARTAQAVNFDDCVLIDLGEALGREDLPYLVYSIDHPSFVQHASDRVTPYRFYGRWLAAVTCNDVVAMGAQCRGFSLDLAAPLDTKIADVQELLAGISDVLDEYGAAYEGGNFDGNPLETVGFCWGIVPRHAVVRRGGAKPGDIIAVTGILGQGWMEYLVRKNSLYSKLDATVAELLERYKEMPVAAHRPIIQAADRRCFSSGMDLSDGLVEFLYTIASGNRCAAVVDLEQLPVSAATRACVKHVANVLRAPSILETYPGITALEPGYDSPLVHGFTVPRDRWGEVRLIFERSGNELHSIGSVVEGAGVRLRIAGAEIDLPEFWDDQCRVSGLADGWVEFLETLERRLP